jgi:rubrerythrin
VSELLALAYQIEADAVERYKLLADQMEAHNNPELVKVFRDLAKAEAIHAKEIQQQAGDIDAADAASIVRRLGAWKSGDSPEEADLSAAHYLMTPWHALQMALAGEKRALAFFSDIVETTTDAKIKQMAAEFVEEEVEHVNLVNRLLHKYPVPPASWSEDPDPPNALE